MARQATGAGGYFLFFFQGRPSRQISMVVLGFFSAPQAANDFKAPKREPAEAPLAKQSRRQRRRSRHDSASSDSGSDVKK